MKYLIDASSLVVLLQKEVDLRGHYVLDLTLYELGNVIRKEAAVRRIISEKEAKALMDSLSTILKFVNVVRISEEDLAGILEVSLKESLTFYDASYLYYAKKLKVGLITEDEGLLNAAKKYVEAIKAEEFLRKLKTSKPSS